MAPPTFGDLGKSARDVFGKGYNFGVMKLDVKTKTDSDVQLNSGLVSNVDSGKVKLKLPVLNHLCLPKVSSRSPAIWRPSTSSRTTD